MNASFLSTNLDMFERIKLIDAPTPLQRMERLSAQVGRDIYVKRDDLTSLAMGGNKVRKLEYFAADAVLQKADVLVTAGAIQSNHVRQTAALAIRLGMKCVALLQNPIGTTSRDYLENGNRLLVDLMGVEVQEVETLENADQLLNDASRRLSEVGHRPYVIPIGGSNTLGSLGYVRAALELEQQIRAEGLDVSAVVLASGSGGSHAGMALTFAHAMPAISVIGVTVSKTAALQRPKVENLINGIGKLLKVEVPSAMRLDLWDEYFAPRYGEPSRDGMNAIRLTAATEGLLLDPVYTGKAMAGLLDGLACGRIAGDGPVVFLHTGGAPALFAYPETCMTPTTVEID